MALRDMLSKNGTSPLFTQPSSQAEGKGNFFYEVKQKFHTRLVEEANLSALDVLDAAEISAEISDWSKYFPQEKAC